MSQPQRILFDTPGPKGRRRLRVASITASAGVAAVAYLVFSRFDHAGQLAAARWRPFTQWSIIHFLLVGLGTTLASAGVAAAVALPLGLVVAVGRLSQARAVRLAAAAYAELFRAVPLLILIYIFLLALPAYGIRLPGFWQLTVPLIISSGATLAEIFRSGILSVERGQTEAAYSIGLSRPQALRIVVVPQAVRRLSPAIVSQLVALLKGTSLGYVVSYGELLNQGEILGEYSHNLIQTYLVVALLYVMVNASLSRLARYLETRQSRRGRRTRRGRDAGEAMAVGLTPGRWPATVIDG